ncbi:MAG: DUF1501 domain-containing protein [SAR202 cluster bacterium]|nr:hypothetical protein [Chloroflexota bacterium]MQG02641.1 DUF1501 domain-containing protein [SAR202 cluster bacterium]HAE32621.1 hypothetical protein [Dehalococcoidia bacterium]|tara:strand:+ start:3767 stop:4909 length:1143 start_codon:yes stop_codon:yes gene_type:complete
MTTTAKKNPVFVVVQLSGGNDFMNTLIPYTNSVYYDNRKLLNIPQEDVLPLDNTLGWHPEMAPFKELYDKGMVAVVQGIGYPDSNRSHFRGMDIWHTCTPNEVSTIGWLGNTIELLDPSGENPLTGVNFGVGLPKAMTKAGVPVTSVSNLDSYGLMSGITAEEQRDKALQIFKNMYGQAIGTGPVMEYLSRTGNDVLTGADLIKVAPENYVSSIEYADSAIAKSLRDVARVHTADLGTRIFYTQQGGYDTHANQQPAQPGLFKDLARAVNDFFADLEEHESDENVVMLIFSEFGRRVYDNGSGTDHGSGGGAFLVGKPIEGGLYSEYPSLDRDRWAKGEDLEHTIDYRGIYGTVLEQWLGIEATPIVQGNYEQINPFKSN